MTDKHSPLVEYMSELEKRTEKSDMTLNEIVQLFGQDGHFVLVLFFIIPFLQPIPMFGLSTPFGLLISVMAFFSFLNKPPSVPDRWKNKVIPRATIQKIAIGSERFFLKLESVVKPRIEVLFNGPFRVINFGIVMTQGILLALPLPVPLSNAIPAWVIFLQTLGQLKRDGILILISYFLSLLSLIFFGLLAYGALTGISFLDGWFKSH